MDTNIEKIISVLNKVKGFEKITNQDFWAYAIERFECCNLLMQNPDFNQHISAIKKNKS